ncbi:MAG: hypothetical protein R3E67_00315 [Pseudomonadales bacterium]
MGVFIHIHKTIADDSDNNNGPLHDNQRLIFAQTKRLWAKERRCGISADKCTTNTATSGAQKNAMYPCCGNIMIGSDSDHLYSTARPLSRPSTCPSRLIIHF